MAERMIGTDCCYEAGLSSTSVLPMRYVSIGSVTRSWRSIFNANAFYVAADINIIVKLVSLLLIEE